jgi:DNA ligase-associated metallophosphoesterase
VTRPATIPDAGAPVEFAGQTLVLLPQRGVWWPARGALLVADPHLGKPASFRDAGAPVPEAVTRRDLDRLSALIDALRPERLVVLGDFVHDRCAWRDTTMRQLAAWRGGHASTLITLVRGNHDRRAEDPPAALGVETVEPGWRLGPIAMHHEPTREGPALCGHLHPAITLHARRRADRLRAPCFWFSRSLGVLPAFGSFTGGAVVKAAPGDRVFAAGASSVIEVHPAPASTKASRDG